MGILKDAMTQAMDQARAEGKLPPKTPEPAKTVETTWPLTGPRWEYKVLNTGFMKNTNANRLENTLNDLGRQGWELTGVVDEPKSAMTSRVTQYLFKRPMT